MSTSSVLDAVRVLALSSPELLEFWSKATPLHVFVPFAPNPLHLYDPAQLAERSAGYFGESWSSDWLVIGDVGGDPVIADTALPGTPISLAMHGAGIWRPMTVAPTPASFLAAVAAWLRVLLAYDGEHLDAKNDFCVKPGFYQALTEHLRAVLPDDCVRALIEYLET